MGRRPEWNVYRQCVHCGRWRSLGYFCAGKKRTCAGCYAMRVGYGLAITRRNGLRLTAKGRRAIQEMERVA